MFSFYELIGHLTWIEKFSDSLFMLLSFGFVYFGYRIGRNYEKSHGSRQ